jgi:hypothetical protein
MQIYSAMQMVHVEKLTHFHTPVLDRLLKLLGPPYQLTPQQRVELANELTLRERDMSAEIDDEERAAAQILPLIIAGVERENAAPAEIFDLILVAVPKSADDKVGMADIASRTSDD